MRESSVVARFAAVGLATALLAAQGACAPAPLPTPTAYPTHTPAPTQAPYPTQAPLPTNTPLPTFTPLPTPSLTPTAAPTETPPPTRPPAPTATPVPKALAVEFTNIHYNCQNQCFQKKVNAPPQVWLYAYRTFEFNVHVQNLTSDRTLAGGWLPRVTIADGASEHAGVPVNWPVLMGGYATVVPQVGPGQAADHSFVVFLPGTAMFVKSISLEAWGETYVLALKSRPGAVSNDYKDCGLQNARFCPNGMPAWDPYNP